MLLRQDPRYFVLNGFVIPARSALGQIVVARNDAGHRTLNVSEFLGNAMAGYI